MSALVFSDVKVRYTAREREIWALAGVDARIEPGTLTAIVGPNGAGKTTLIKAAAGLLPLTSGSCVVLDRNIAAWPRDDLARRVAYLPQTGEAAWPIPANQIVALGRMPHGGGLSRLSAADADAVSRAMARTDTTAFAARAVNRLSAGERARVLMARALATGADVLLADEPAAHLDPAHQLQLLEILREEARRGVTVLVTLHELTLAARCDRVLVLKEGRVAAHGRPETALADDVLAGVFAVAARRTEGGLPVPWEPI